jgi:hypothetical protein
MAARASAACLPRCEEALRGDLNAMTQRLDAFEHMLGCERARAIKRKRPAVCRR